MGPETAARVMIQRQKQYQGPEFTRAQEQQHYKGPETAAVQGLKNSSSTRHKNSSSTRAHKQQQYQGS